MSVQSDLFKKITKKLAYRKESLVVTDARYRDNPIIFCNQEFTKLTGYKLDDIIGQNCRFLQNDDTNQPESLFLGGAIIHNRPCKVILRNYKKTGELFWNELSLAPIVNERGESLYFVGIQKDVTNEVAEREEVVKVFKTVLGLGGKVVGRGKTQGLSSGK